MLEYELKNATVEDRIELSLRLNLVDNLYDLQDNATEYDPVLTAVDGNQSLANTVKSYRDLREGEPSEIKKIKEQGYEDLLTADQYVVAVPLKGHPDIVDEFVEVEPQVNQITQQIQMVEKTGQVRATIPSDDEILKAAKSVANDLGITVEAYVKESLYNAGTKAEVENIYEGKRWGDVKEQLSSLLQKDSEPDRNNEVTFNLEGMDLSVQGKVKTDDKEVVFIVDDKALVYNPLRGMDKAIEKAQEKEGTQKEASTKKLVNFPEPSKSKGAELNR